MDTEENKIIFITGGVVSSLGKGVTAASIGTLMEAWGFKISFLKLDPYLNVDPGTMSPYQHGEVYVTEDGAETDLDLGHYERFTSVITSKKSNCTSGQIYNEIIAKERKGDYLGETIQVIPHVTDLIKSKIIEASKDVNILICEVGGTVGDIEGIPFLEAIRQIRLECSPKNILCIHLTLIPFISTANELKTKPTQHSVQKLREIGIQADILLCRSEKYLSLDIKNKIALFCSVRLDSVFEVLNVSSVYNLPGNLALEGVDTRIIKILDLEPKQNKKPYISFTGFAFGKKTVKVGVVGKYNNFTEAYKSLNEAIIHASYRTGIRVTIEHINSDSNYNYEYSLKKLDGILVPGGFGSRGTNGKLSAITFARENKIPFFGICFGMHLAVVEFARNVLKYTTANSTEIDPETEYPVICLLEDVKNCLDMGGTMRLGSYSCKLVEGTKAHSAYDKTEIQERHRHRYEFNNKFTVVIENSGLILSGKTPDDMFVEIVELKDHPYFLACQFHPEFKSKLADPHPLFTSFIKAMEAYKYGRV